MSSLNQDRSRLFGPWGARLAGLTVVWLAVVLVAVGCGATAEPPAAPTEAAPAVAQVTSTAVATDVPAAVPTDVPAVVSTDVPTAVATDVPTDAPTAATTDVRTAEPTGVPTAAPGQPTAVLSGEAEVEIEDFAFQPKVLVVRVGTEVKWSNKDDMAHTTTSDSGVWDSGYLNKGDDFLFTFTEPGEYPYYCIPHGGPGGVGMSGVVIVVE